MANLLGEQLLAVTGIMAALEPGPLKVTKAKLREADRVPKLVADRCRDFFGDAFPERGRALPAFDYEKVLELLAEPVTPERVAENVAGWRDRVLADAYAEALGRAWAWLQAKIPRKVRERPPFEVEQVRPGDLELMRFRRAFWVVERPLVVLDDMLEGDLVADQVTTLSEVFPALFELMGDTAVDALIDARAERGEAWRPGMKRDALLRKLLQTEHVNARIRKAIQAVHEESRAAREQAPQNTPQAKATAGANEATPQQKLDAR